MVRQVAAQRGIKHGLFYISCLLQEPYYLTLGSYFLPILSFSRGSHSIALPYLYPKCTQ
jgi:hypothetical protein